MPSDPRTCPTTSSCRRKRHFRVRVRSLLSTLCAFLLSGALGACDSVGSQNARSASTPNAANTSTENPIAPLTPPGASDRPAAPGTGAGLAALPGMQPPKGLNVETLFAEDIREPMDRIRRVENVVLDLRRDFNTALPSIMRLVAVEQDMQNLIGQLQTLTESSPVPAAPEGPAGIPGANSGLEMGADPTGATQHPPSAQAGRAEDSQPPPQTAPPAQPPPEASASPAPNIPSTESAVPSGDVSVSRPQGESTVESLRLSAHPDKTRIVLTMDKPLEVRTYLEEGQKRLVIDLPGARWTAPTQGQAPEEGSLVESWATEPLAEGPGTRLIVTLKAPITLSPLLKIPPAGTQKPRLAFDLKSAP